MQMMGYYVYDSTLSMTIVSHPFNWRVTRTNADFETLRHYLVAKFPQTIVPCLPKYTFSKTLTDKQLTKRQGYYERFLLCILKSMTLRSCDYLVDFLKEAHVSTFIRKATTIGYEHGPHKVEELSILGGEIDVAAAVSATKFCENLPHYVDSCSDISSL